MTTDGQKTPPESSATVLVTLGRIEERLNSMKENESRNATRLDALEKGMQEVKNELSTMRGAARPRAPWWVIVSIIFGLITALSTTGGILYTLYQIAQAMGH